MHHNYIAPTKSDCTDSEYAYDSNGNVTHDYNRGITEISYNVVNLPSRIDIIGDRSVEYIYDASGRKLSCLIKEADNYLVEAAMFSLPDGSMLPEPNRTVSSREYIGAYGFENGELLRLNTPYGYCTLGSYIPYRRDYQGNNRNNADYYAYGLPVQDSNVSDQDPYLYGGKEFYSVKGLNIYDFNARTYAPDIARFMQPDPKSGNYHWLSPYAYCAGDPINNIDPDGKNIAVLLVSGVIGHLALLIQDENEVWRYYSVNGDKIYNLTGGSLGGGPSNDVGTGSWSSPQEFMNEAHETTDEERGKDPETINNYDYTEAYEIETTPEQDKEIAESFSEIAKEDYDFINNNCAHAVQRSLLKGKVLPAIITQTISPTSIGYHFEIQKPYMLFPQPYSAYSAIKSHNPNGTEIRKER